MILCYKCVMKRNDNLVKYYNCLSINSAFGNITSDNSYIENNVLHICCIVNITTPISVGADVIAITKNGVHTSFKKLSTLYLLTFGSTFAPVAIFCDVNGYILRPSSGSGVPVGIYYISGEALLN